VSQSGPREAGPGVPAARSNLALRVASAAVLAPIALLVTYMGGLPFALFWVAAAGAVLWEWVALVAGPLWIAAGIGYAVTMFAAPFVLRADAEFGFQVMVLLFAIVWTTDICGYFAGRAIGGPKLMPAISPKKTWAGAIAGTAGAVVVAVAAAKMIGQFNLGAVAVIAFILSVVAQGGDLMESAIKRHFGAKDASHIIPGHGGVMDRLDGFWTAAIVAAVIGIARGGWEDAARGLLIW
jgi:phosphatidate cytidylyltransferase